VITSAFEDFANTVTRPILRDASDDVRFWRVEEPELDDDGKVILGGMWSFQQEWWELPNFIKALVGGYGCGKTLIGCKRIISGALQNAPVPSACVSPTYIMARQTTISTLQELLAGKQTLYGHREFWWDFNKTSHHFRIRFHGREANILIYSGENPLSLRGPNLGTAYIDEPFIQHEDVFKQMVARVRHPHARLMEIILTGTPEQLNWGYDLCTQNEESDIVRDLEEEKLDVGMVRAATAKNLALPRVYVQRLAASLDEKAALAYMEGKFVSLAKGQVYYSFDRDENVVRCGPPDGAELGCGMDFNVNPMAAVVFWRSGSHIHFIKEYELENADTEYMCSVLTENFPDLTEVYPDPTGKQRHTNAPGGKSDFHFIREAGLEVNARRGSPKRRDRYNAVNAKLKAKNGKVFMTIDPSCRKLIKYLSVYSHELINKQQDMSHLLDAATYPVEYLWPLDRSALKVKKFVGA
jgi:hypothetical protein